MAHVPRTADLVTNARPLVEPQSNVPEIGFLGGGQGIEINEAIKKDYRDIPALQVVNYADGIIKGSNPFYVVAVQERLPENVRVASQADLEKALKWGVFDLRGTYEDTGLVLRNEGESNSYLARDLKQQIKAINPRKRLPVMIPLYGLTLEKDQNSPHGVRFKLSEDTDIIYSQMLKKADGNFSEADLKTGLPKKLGEGNRRFWTRDKGLSRLYLNRYLNLYSDDVDLACSGDSGRVVLISGEATSRKVSGEKRK